MVLIWHSNRAVMFKGNFHDTDELRRNWRRNSWMIKPLNYLPSFCKQNLLKKSNNCQRIEPKKYGKFKWFVSSQMVNNVHLMLFLNLFAFRETVNDEMVTKCSARILLICVELFMVYAQDWSNFCKKLFFQSRFLCLFWRQDHAILQKSWRCRIVEFWNKLTKSNKCFLEKRLSLVE